MNASFALKRLVVIIAFCWIAGCAGQTRNQDDWRCARDDAPCPAAYVVHDSWHAAIVLRKADVALAALPEMADFPAARFVEFSWGDQDYFPNPDSGFFLALKAAFWSSGSVLHLVGVEDDLRKFYPKAEVVELRLNGAAYDRLITFLSESFLRTPTDGRAQARTGLYDYSRFYPSTRSFSLLNTCNTWVAKALAAAGLPISTPGIVSAGQMADQLARIAPTAPAN
jgi:uncharacterized protein (TIGR02117 family)